MSQEYLERCRGERWETPGKQGRSRGGGNAGILIENTCLGGKKQGIRECGKPCFSLPFPCKNSVFHSKSCLFSKLPFADFPASSMQKIGFLITNPAQKTHFLFKILIFFRSCHSPTYFPHQKLPPTQPIREPTKPLMPTY